MLVPTLKDVCVCVSGETRVMAIVGLEALPLVGSERCFKPHGVTPLLRS